MNMTTPESVQLQLQPFALKLNIPGEILNEMSIEPSYMNWATDQVTLALKTRVWAHNLPPERVTETRRLTLSEPATWWQHWKLDHAASPLLWRIARRWPVRMVESVYELDVTVDLQRFQTYPDAPVLADRVGNGLGVAYNHHTVHSSAMWRNSDVDGD